MRPFLVYRCRTGEPIKHPEAVISLWPEDVPRFAAILDEAAALRPGKARQPGEYWEIVPKEEADPYDWDKVTGHLKRRPQDPLGDMWRERARIERLVEQGVPLEEALEVMTPLAHTMRYESAPAGAVLARLDQQEES
jgi:hypothetical protein